MVTVTMPTFTDFLHARGASRLTKIRDAKKLIDSPEDYPRVDYYKSLRRPLVETLVSGGDLTELDACLGALTDAKKVGNYRAIRNGLAAWVGSTDFKGTEVIRRYWTSGELAVSVRPQARIKIAGQWLVVYCYLKAEELDRYRVQPTLHLLKQTHGDLGEPLLLDVRRSKTYQISGRSQRGMDALLESEALAFVRLWESDLDAA